MSDWEKEKKVILSKVKGLVDMIALPTETWLAKSTDLKFLKVSKGTLFPQNIISVSGVGIVPLEKGICPLLPSSGITGVRKELEVEL